MRDFARSATVGRDASLTWCRQAALWMGADRGGSSARAVEPGRFVSNRMNNTLVLWADARFIGHVDAFLRLKGEPWGQV